MEALGAAASIAGLVSLVIEIPKLIDTAISIHSAPEEAAQLSRTVDALVTTLQRLEAFLKTDEAQDMQMADDSALTLSISSCQKRILDLSRKLRKQAGLSSSLSTGQPFSKVNIALYRFRWPLEKAECLDIITDLHIMESTFEFCLVIKNCQEMSRSHKEVISHFKTQSQALNDLTASFPQQAEQAKHMLSKLEAIQLCMENSIKLLSSIQIGVDVIEEKSKGHFAAYQTEEHHGQVLEWLSPLDTTLRHEEIKADRFPETCEWIVHDAEFLSWCRTLPSEEYNGISCWIGDPGQGKTYSMSRIVEHLQAFCSVAPGAYVTYLYCDYQRTRNYSVTSLVGALLRQLLGQFETIPEDVLELARHANTKLRRPSARMDELISVLALLAPRINRLFICIDALDENPRAEEFVAACEKLPLEKSMFFIGRRSILQSLRWSYSSVSYRNIEPQNDDINAVLVAKLSMEAKRDPDLMPDDLRTKIQSSIARVAHGMFLLATLHLTLVLSRNTIFKRRLALDDLPTTLPMAFDKTLARIQEHTYASQALRVLALIHHFGPLSFELLRNYLAVEPSHAQFQHDNLPSRLTMLDCCMGLVRPDTPAGTSTQHGKVVIAHETLSTYFNSKKHVLEHVLVDIIGIFIAMLSFSVSPRLRYVQLFAERSWVPLLYELETLPLALSDRIWEYVVELNKQINDGNHNSLPMHAWGLHLESDSTLTLHRKTTGQSLLHTICMLDLDGLSLIMKKFTNLSDRDCDSYIGSLDKFGMSPMGWILSPSYLQSTQNSSTKSLEQRLRRAESLMSMYPRTEPVKSLWNATAMVQCQRLASGHTALYFFTAVPIFWFFSNYSVAPKAVQRCIEAMNQYWNLDIWSAVGNAYRATSLPTTLSSQWTPANKFKMIYVRSRELDQSRQLPNNHRNILIVFGPERDAQTPGLVLSSASELSMDFSNIPEDVIIHNINPFPDIDGYVVSLSEETILHFGVFNDDVKIVNFALSRLKLGPNLQDQIGNTAQEISRRHEEKCVAIQPWDPDISFETQGPERSYLLQYCVHRHEDSVASVLLKTGIDISLQDSWGRTALHYAAKIKAEATIRLLLDNGAGIDINIQDSWGRTALHYAAKSGAAATVRLLLERGAGINIADSNSRTALHDAVEYGSRQTVEILMENESCVNIVDSNRRIPLHLAIIRRDLPICQMLFDAGHASGLTPRNLGTAFNLALGTGGEFATRFLCSVQSASLRLPGDGEQHPSNAMVHGNRIHNMTTSMGEILKWTVDDLRFMTRLAADSNDHSLSTRIVPMSCTGSGTYDWSATICSAIASRADSVAAYLLRTFAIDIDHLQVDGESALHLAVIYDTCRVFQLLLDHEKVDTTAHNSEGYTALHLTLVHKNLDFLWVMLCSPRINVGQEVRGSGATALHLAIKHDFIDAVPLLLSCPQINFDKLDGSGRAVLHHAVLKQDIALVKLLLGCPKLTPTIPSRDGRTALAYAALCADKDMVALLLEVGTFDLHLKDSYGKTAVDWARQNSIPGVIEMLEAARDLRDLKNSFCEISFY